MNPGRTARDPLARAIERAIQTDSLLRPGEALILAVSGGPDSVVLAHVIASLVPTRGWRLLIGHLDHQLREDSAADARYVRNLAARLGLPVRIGARDVGSLARAGGLSLEDAARRARYAFLAELARESGASAVVTGHQRDDQAETILLHLIQGAGPDGLRGMAGRAPLPLAPDLDLVRPLLDVSRAEIEEFCHRHRLRPRRDPSNESPRFTRNRIRHQILPALAEINPEAAAAIARLGRAIRADAEWIDGQADGRWEALAQECPGGIRFPAADLSLEPPPLRVRLIRRAAVRLGVSLNARQVEATERCLATPGGGKIALGPRVWFWRSDDWCGVGLPPAPAPGWPAVRLPCPGQVEWGPWSLSATYANALPEPDPAIRGPWSAVVEGASLPPRLVVRGRRAGDRLHLRRPFGSKSLQDFFVDSKVPRRDRDTVPIVLAGDHLVWIAGHRVDRCFQPAEPPRRPVILRAGRKDRES